MAKSYTGVQEELRSILDWLLPAMAHDLNPTACPKPDKSRLMIGLETGSHSSGLFTGQMDIGSDNLPIIVQTKGEMRTPRIVDAPVIALIRLHTVFGETARLEKNAANEAVRRDYLVMFSDGLDKVHLLRLIVDAGPGTQVPEAPGAGGYDYRRGVLTLPPRSDAEVARSGKRSRSSSKGREFAIAHSLGNYDKFVAANGRAPITRGAYEASMRSAYVLLDRIPLAFTQKEASKAA